VKAASVVLMTHVFYVKGATVKEKRALKSIEVVIAILS
jgi:hypothetical protein